MKEGTAVNAHDAIAQQWHAPRVRAALGGGLPSSGAAV
jgi:hypothetical protein